MKEGKGREKEKEEERKGESGEEGRDMGNNQRKCISFTNLLGSSHHSHIINKTINLIKGLGQIHIQVQ